MRKSRPKLRPVFGAIGQPLGEKTKLGWSIMSPGKEVDLSPMSFTQTSHVDYDNLCKLHVPQVRTREEDRDAQRFHWF